MNEKHARERNARRQRIYDKSVEELMNTASHHDELGIHRAHSKKAPNIIQGQYLFLHWASNSWVRACIKSN